MQYRKLYTKMQNIQKLLSPCVRTTMSQSLKRKKLKWCHLVNDSEFVKAVFRKYSSVKALDYLLKSPFHSTLF